MLSQQQTNSIYTKEVLNMKTFVIGDLHGCYKELETLLEGMTYT